MTTSFILTCLLLSPLAASPSAEAAAKKVAAIASAARAEASAAAGKVEEAARAVKRTELSAKKAVATNNEDFHQLSMGRGQWRCFFSKLIKLAEAAISLLGVFKPAALNASAAPGPNTASAAISSPICSAITSSPRAPS